MTMNKNYFLKGKNTVNYTRNPVITILNVKISNIVQIHFFNELFNYIFIFCFYFLFLFLVFVVEM